MGEQARRADRFHTLSGLLGVIAGPVLLLRGAPAGWSFLLIAAGALILFAQSAIVNDLEFRIPDRTQFLVAAVGLVCIAIAVVYLTRAADDLPSLFPGHDGDSEHYRIVPGLVALMTGLVGLGRTLPLVRPLRPAH
jgi:hypothetical protein